MRNACLSNYLLRLVSCFGPYIRLNFLFYLLLDCRIEIPISSCSIFAPITLNWLHRAYKMNTLYWIIISYITSMVGTHIIRVFFSYCFICKAKNSVIFGEVFTESSNNCKTYQKKTKIRGLIRWLVNHSERSKQLCPYCNPTIKDQPLSLYLVIHMWNPLAFSWNAYK